MSFWQLSAYPGISLGSNMLHSPTPILLFSQGQVVSGQIKYFWWRSFSWHSRGKALSQNVWHLASHRQRWWIALDTKLILRNSAQQASNNGTNNYSAAAEIDIARSSWPSRDWWNFEAWYQIRSLADLVPIQVPKRVKFVSHKARKRPASMEYYIETTV